MTLCQMGWSGHFEKYLTDEKQSVARILSVHRSLSRGWDEEGSINLYLSGKDLMLNGEVVKPSVGDWVSVSPSFTDEQGERASIIAEILPRKTSVSRLGSGEATQKQVLAANVDIVFIVTSINKDFNINRLGRYLLMANGGGAKPVFVLSKSDLSSDSHAVINSLREKFQGVDVIKTSSLNGEGISEVKEKLQSSLTGVFVGSSGVGKSTLVNSLLGNETQLTQEVREYDDRGRHTTTHRELFFTPEGGMIIDTPGLREVQIFGDENSLEVTFGAFAKYAEKCRFSDCEHSEEPGCEVKAAISRGEVSEKDFVEYKKLKREMEHSNRKMDASYQAEQKKKWKEVSKTIKGIKKRRR